MYNSLVAGSGSAPFDLSKATKLGDAVFRPGSLSVRWISLVFQDITSKHRDLRRTSVDLPYCLRYFDDNEDPMETVGEGFLEQWLGLDRILVYLWESFSIRTNVMGRLEGPRDRKSVV